MQVFELFILIYSQNRYVLVCFQFRFVYPVAALYVWGKAFICVFLGCVVSYTSKSSRFLIFL